MRAPVTSPLESALCDLSDLGPSPDEVTTELTVEIHVARRADQQRRVLSTAHQSVHVHGPYGSESTLVMVMPTG
jgi:hypothetical protein